MVDDGFIVMHFSVCVVVEALRTDVTNSLCILCKVNLDGRSTYK